MVAVAEWVRALDSGDLMVQGSKPHVATSLRNVGNSVYPALPVSFGGDTKSRRSLLSGAYARRSKISHSPHWNVQLSWTPPLLEKDNSINNHTCVILKFECFTAFTDSIAYQMTRQKF